MSEPQPFWTLDRVADALGRRRSEGPRGPAPLAAITTDTRSIKPGELFVALRGERFDAHDFLDQAVAAGAAALMVSDVTRARAAGVPVFVVDDTTAALGALARYRRRAWGNPVIAIAGSNGKTSTKELVAAALGSRLEVHATRGNLNNQIGVPLTLLALPDSADIAVIEMGTNHPGEIAPLRAIAEPDAAIVTSIGEEHLEGFGDLTGVLREESAVLDGVELAIVPANHPELLDEARRRARRTIVAGLGAGDIRAERWGIEPDGSTWLEIDGQMVRPSLRGEHNLRNTMLALAAATRFGISLEDAARGVAATPALSMRMAWQAIGDLTVINDAYNANPASAREAIRVLDGLQTSRQKVLVLGSMLELGPTGPALHDEIARRALDSSAALVAGIGEFVRALTEATDGAEGRVVVAPDVPDLWNMLAPRLASDAIIMLKGSRGMKLERIVPLLTSSLDAQR